MKLKDLAPDPHNANKGTERGRAMLEDSLKRYGAGRSILVDKHGRVIAGNKTLETAIESGFDEVEVIQTDGKKIVAVQRVDLDLLKDDSARQLAYADNRVSEVDLEFNPEQILKDVEQGLDFDGLWTQKELDDLVKDLLPQEDPPAQIDQAEELQKKWQVKDKDVWEIGRHRLMCGDATIQEDVEKLLDGNNPNLTVTDPPYGVEYDAAWRSRGAEEGWFKYADGSPAYAPSRIGKVKNDEQVDWKKAWELCPGPVIYTWSPGGDPVIITGQLLQESGFQIRNQIMWRKPHFPISRGHYTYQHEPLWYAVRKGQKSHWIGDANASTVWDITLDTNVVGGHSTQKPQECMARPISNHEGDVYDPFLGSGTTMVAAENLNRTCYGMEIHPPYCAVILQRLEDMGLKPIRNKICPQA
jgi:DNA modification methylase